MSQMPDRDMDGYRKYFLWNEYKAEHQEDTGEKNRRPPSPTKLLSYSTCASAIRMKICNSQRAQQYWCVSTWTTVLSRNAAIATMSPQVYLFQRADPIFLVPCRVGHIAKLDGLPLVKKERAKQITAVFSKSQNSTHLTKTVLASPDGK